MSAIHEQAFREARQFIYGPKEITGEITVALGQIATNQWENVPRPRSIEAIKFRQRTKPERYAYLAGAIERLFEQTFEKSGEYDYELPATITQSDHPWHAASKHLLNIFQSNINLVKNTLQYQEASKVNELIEYLLPGKGLELSTQLVHGSATALKSTLPFLHNLPSIARIYQPSIDPAQFPYIALNSSSLVYELMRRSVPSMMAARTVLAGGNTWHEYSKIELGYLKPIYRNGQLVALTYRDLENARLQWTTDEDDYQYLKDIDEAVKRNITVVGCPLSLLYGRYKQFIKRTVLAVDKVDLWHAG